MSANQKKQLQLCQSKNELLAEAEKNILLAPMGLQASIRLYYISRYFVAIYECRYQQVPLQVWNEYRNALDHFFRHLTAGGEVKSLGDANGHIKKMEGHLQRAVLDILKLFSHKTHDSIKTLKEEHGQHILKLVDNGAFIQTINDELQKASRDFEFAKVSDLKLGNDSVSNADVLEIYLDAAFAFDGLQYLIISKEQDIMHAREQYEQIHSSGHKHSFIEGVKIHFLTHALWAAGAAAITAISLNITEIKQIYTDLTIQFAVQDEKVIDKPAVISEKTQK